MAAYYNEIDPYAAQWLRNLIAAGHIALGEVDERSIVDVRADDLRGFKQCHFFAGVGVWSYALRLAGWSDDRPVWTGSCPCQPFSAAGAGKEFADDRHLWPAWFELLRERRPVAVFGEQVASRDALAWLDHVCADLEGEGYAVGAVDTCAAGYGAPHIRQRLYWVAQSDGGGLQRHELQQSNISTGRGATSLMADAADEGANRGQRIEGGERNARRPESGGGGVMGDAQSGGLGIGGNAAQSGSGGHADSTGVMGNAEQPGSQGCKRPDDMELHRGSGANGSIATAGFWSDAIWLPCRDGKARPTQPGLFPLAHGARSRVGRLRAYGNAIVAPQAAEFVRAFLKIVEDRAESACNALSANDSAITWKSTKP